MTDALLTILEGRASYCGLVLAREETLRQELRTSHVTLVESLTRLESDGSIKILAPLPFLVLRFRKWSGKRPDASGMSRKPATAEVHAYSFQSSLSQSKQLKESYRRPAEEDVLLREILETLGESDPTTFRGALKRYPPGIIRTALGRIRRMKNVRKNRTAVFRFLLPRIAKETPSNN